VRLLCWNKKVSTLWQYPATSGVEGEECAPTESLELSYFYNSGGLHAFSDDETVLVLCVPTHPTWSLLAFDLKAQDIPGSMRQLPYANLLRGAHLTSFCFPRTQNAHLCLLDSLGNMRVLQMSDPSTNAAHAAPEHMKPILLSGVISQNGEYKVYSSSVAETGSASSSHAHSTLSSGQSHKVFLTDVGSLGSTESTSINLDWVGQARTIRSDTLVVDSNPVVQATTTGLMTNFDVGTKLFQGAQNTLNELTSSYHGPDILTPPEQPVSRTTTAITFDPTVNRTFIHSFIYKPLPDVQELQKWSQTMTMEVYDVADPNNKMLEVFRGPDVEVAAEGYLASAIHEDLLAFSSSSAHANPANDTILCVWDLKHMRSGGDESEHSPGYVEHNLRE
jgi:hypothetical protein